MVYHTGGIAGVGNFASGTDLKSNELQSILQMGEYIFQPDQLKSLMLGIAKKSISRFTDIAGMPTLQPMIPTIPPFLSTQPVIQPSSYDANSMKIDINISGEGQVDEDKLNETVGIAVKRSLTEIKRNNRLESLRDHGRTIQPVKKFF
jgi:hypothetical protein